MAIVYTDGRVEHAGRVLRVISRDERIMSDVYALVRYAVCVHVGTGAPIEVRLGDCEFGQSSAIAGYEVDATEAAICEHAGYVERAEYVRRQQASEAAAARAKADREREAAAPRKGRKVIVIRGRKVPLGTEGVCIWVGEGTWGERCGIKDASGEVHWTAASNVVAIDCEAARKYRAAAAAPKPVKARKPRKASDVHTRPTVRP